MVWISTKDDEVKVFHPAFEEIATESLKELGLDADYKWVHHDTSASGGIPDYVLKNTKTNQWALVVEIKRTRSAVTSSTQFRRQAHSYVLENFSRFRRGAPLLYCLSNLEQTQLFGANDKNDLATSPNARQIEGWNHGDFSATTEKDHKEQLKSDLKELLETVHNPPKSIKYKLDFPSSWAPIKEAGIEAGLFLPAAWGAGTFGPWFASCEPSEARGLLLATQCLLAEWIVYQIEQHQHPDKAKLIPLKAKKSDTKNRNHVVDVLQRILQIDFEGVLGGTSTPDNIKRLTKAETLTPLKRIVDELEQLQTDQLSALVGESGFPDLLFEELQSYFNRSRRGTVQTDPELAMIVATLGLYGMPNDCVVIDPCAGIGNLLTAAYNTRTSEAHKTNINNLVAVEIDPIQSALSALQLLMQAPSLAAKDCTPVILQDSMFKHPDLINKADVVLMNPPFKRYEDDGDPLPKDFTKQMLEAIRANNGGTSLLTRGQADLYNYYVELVISAMKKGARGVFILNNKWMNTKTTNKLRKFLSDYCTVEALIQYPQGELFKSHLIATSILVFRKGIPRKENKSQFVKCLTDLREIGLQDIVEAAYKAQPSSHIKVSTRQHHEIKNRSSQKSSSWRSFFTPPSCLGLLSTLPTLLEHFDSVVQGRLERDEVSKVVSFPFRDWTKKGTGKHNSASKAFLPGKKREAAKGGFIAEKDLQALSDAAATIPEEFRGYALKVANRMGSDLNFELTPENMSHSYEGGATDGILEPPSLRTGAWDRGPTKAKWDDDFETALDAMRKHPEVGRFIDLVETKLGLSNRPNNIVWEDLLRPCAGELILVRAFRTSWRAHLNPLAFTPEGRQLRISSNFYSFRGVSSSTGHSSCTDGKEATRIILAFLLSSFGQIQFEYYGDNREGLRKCEKAECISKIRVPHPATYSAAERASITSLLKDLHCPIDCETHPHSDPKRRELDIQIAAYLLKLQPNDIKVIKLVDQTANELDELLRERLG